MNFLELCQRTAREAGMSSLSTVDSQTGDLAMIVEQVKEAWNDLQMARFDWKFMWREVQFRTKAGEWRYDAATVRRWSKAYGDTVIYDEAIGEADERPINFCEWRVFKARHRTGLIRLDRPRDFSIDPKGRLCLGPVPDKGTTASGSGYLLTAEVQSTASEMSANTDTPGDLPDQYHRLISDGALLKYAATDEAPNIYQAAIFSESKLYQQLINEQTPDWAFGGESLYG